MSIIKDRAIDGIMAIINSKSALPRRLENTFDSETKVCLECGKTFVGNYKTTICSDKCRNKRANTQERYNHKLREAKEKRARIKRERENSLE